MNLKLNNKRTILVGLAFLSICSFWQMYNSVIPKILTYTFHLDETYSGIIMAADNVLALFLLPLFGAISDKSRSRMGRRMPFILVGTGCAVLLMMLLPILDNSYAANPSVTKLVLFIAVLGLLLVAMGTYRSPAVALMPDVTPKPLRSRANAIINLMGAVGGILYLLITSVLYSSSRVAGLEHVNYLPLFAIVAGIMAVSVGILFATIREKKLHEENMKLEAEHPEWNLAEVDESGNEKLPPAVRRSLGFLLASIALWFIGYNAIETWFTTFADRMWGMALGDATLCLTIATAGAICCYIPVGIAASRIGRRLPSMSTACLWLWKCARAAMSASLPVTITPPAWRRRPSPPLWRAGCSSMSATRCCSCIPPSLWRWRSSPCLWCATAMSRLKPSAA